jgi:hypothetical protein
MPDFDDQEVEVAIGPHPTPRGRTKEDDALGLCDFDDAADDFLDNLILQHCSHAVAPLRNIQLPGSRARLYVRAWRTTHVCPKANDSPFDVPKTMPLGFEVTLARSLQEVTTAV